MAILPAQRSTVARGVDFLSDCRHFATRPRNFVAITGLALAYPVYRITHSFINHLRSLDLLHRDRVAHRSLKFLDGQPKETLGDFDHLLPELHAHIASYLPPEDSDRLQRVNRAAFSHAPFATPLILNRYEHRLTQGWCDEETAFKEKWFGPLRDFLMARDTFLAVLCTAWTGYEAYQTFLQFAPEFAPAIHASRSSFLMLAANGIMLGTLLTDFWKHDPQAKTFTTRLFATLGVFAFSAIGSFCSGQSTVSSCDLSKLHSQLQLPPSVDLRFACIPFHIPSLFLAQAIFFFLFSPLSSNPNFFTLCWLFSVFNFVGSFGLSFIHITQNLTAPTPHPSQSFPFRLCTQFLLNPHCLSSEFHLFAALKPISTYALDLLGKTATYHWNISMVNATEITRELVGISLHQPAPIDPCACTAMATLTNLSLFILSPLGIYFRRLVRFSPPQP